MAEGRMLKRAVSDSRRLSELKTDSARLLWTWILPYLDIEGRYFADPDLIKGKIVPRLKTFTIDLISGYLKDMNRVGLIQLYESDGEKYLQFRNFHLFQKLRKDKEAESKIPTPDLLPTYSGLTPPQEKIREDKRREVKGTADAPFILPTKEEIQESSEPKILEDIKNVCKALYEENIFPEVNSFKNKMLKKKKNERGILHVLTRCYLSKPEEPWGFCQKVLESEDMNYNASDYQKTAR